MTLSLTLDRAYFPDATVGGSVTLEGAKLDFGDGSSLGPGIDLNVSKAFPAYLLVSATLSKQYSAVCHLDGTPWNIQFSYCCRSKNLLANGLTMSVLCTIVIPLPTYAAIICFVCCRILLESEVNLGETSSPVLPLLPPFYIQSNSSLPQGFHLPATSSNGHPLRFSLPSAQAYLSSQAGVPDWVRVDGNTGLLRFNTSLVGQGNGLTCFLLQIDDLVANLKVAIPPPYNNVFHCIFK